MGAKDEADALRRQADQLEEVGELEERLIALKERRDNGEDVADELHAAKYELRDKRQTYRDERPLSAAKPGDATVRAPTVRG